MPLSPPRCARKASHVRALTVRSYRREDGLWDLEGHLTDIWPEPVPRAGGVLPGGEAMHEMWLRLTVDRNATIVAAEACTDAGPYGAACARITPDYAKLVGISIRRGYRDAIRRLLGRTAGCTHLNELAGAMGTAAVQAMWADLAVDPEAQPGHIDGCHALKSDGPQVATYFPKWYRRLEGVSGSSG